MVALHNIVENANHSRCTGKHERTRMSAASANTKNTRYLLGLVVAFIGACFWGFSGVCIQYLQDVSSMSPLFITAVRAVTAALLFIALIAIRYRAQLKALLANPTYVALTCLFGIGLFGSQSTYAVSTGITNAGTATVLQMLASVFVLLIACLKAHRAPKLRELAAVILAVAATWLIATKGDLGTLNIPLAGLAWGILNALAVTLYLIAPERLYARFSSIMVIGCGMCVSAVVSSAVLAAAMLSGQGEAASLIPAASTIGPLSWLALIGGTSVLGTFAAFGMYLWGTSIIGSVKGSLIGVAEPATACILSATLLGTAFTGADWLGFILMAGMLVVISLPQRNTGHAAGAR
jgi:drug/metabolite transporter (DMT)-like permease